MFALTSGMQYFLYRKETDMRNGFDGLCGIVSKAMTRNPLSGDVYVFLNRGRNRIKILHWESGGFILYYKRLERGTIEIPSIDDTSQTCEISWSILAMMVEGISVKNIRRKKRFLLT
jgi:transposase